MATTETSNFKLVKRVRGANFSMEKLASYSLCLQIGLRDFQFCVINKQTNSCLLLEDYKLEGIKTVNSRLEVIREIAARHKALASDVWDSIKVSFKTHKFSIVPNSYFLPEAAGDYLALNAEIKTKMEDVYYYKHISSDAVNIFASDKKVNQWLKKKYPNKGTQVIHQASALIEGILSYDDHSHEKSMFVQIDRGMLHLVVTQNKKLLYYNQFAARKGDEFLKYIMLVFKELGMSPKQSKVVIWGLFKNDSNHIKALEKYIKNISLGTKPNFLKFPAEFEELADHLYFDLYSLFLCE